jgi:hypothetical protein
MQHYRREIDVKAIIEAVLKVRALERTNADVSSTDFVLMLADAYRGWTGEFIDTIVDYAERDLRVARRLRSWRRARMRRPVVFVAAVRVFVARRRVPARGAVRGRAVGALLPAAGA